MAKFKKRSKVILKANIEEGWPEERGVILEVEDQNKYPGMYIVQIVETPFCMEQDDDGIREVHEDNMVEENEMARGHWRNWELIYCIKCNWRDYIKNFKKRKESVPKICPKCGGELKKENEK